MDDGEVRARLYRDGRLLSFSKLPARFPVPGGHIEVDVGNFGLRRCHLLGDDGTTTQMAPDPATAEGWRARLHQSHPVLSRVIGTTATAIVLFAVGVTAPQLIETLTSIPHVTEAVGIIESPLTLSSEANFTIGAAAVIASTERALRLRTSWLDNLVFE